MQNQLDLYPTDDLKTYCDAWFLPYEEETRSGYIVAIMLFMNVANFNVIEDIDAVVDETGFQA